MMNKPTIIFTKGCRSDEGLSKPIIKRLKESDWCDCQVVQLEPQDFIPSYQIMDCVCKGHRHIGNHNAKKPDLIYITGDRVEQCAAANAAFLNQVPIAHYGAGIINDPITTYDDILRHQISLVSDIQFVESEETAGVVWDLKHSVGLKSNIQLVGIPHLDDLEIDESLVPFQNNYKTTTSIQQYIHSEEGINVFIDRKKQTPYSLILYNPPTIKNNDVQEIFANSHLYNDYTILIGSNPDGNTDTYLMDVVDDYYPNLPRAQFLGLLKNCHRFLSNSSACIYEAPHFLKPEQIIMIGDRNLNRPGGPFKTGASDKIVQFLKEYLC